MLGIGASNGDVCVASLQQGASHATAVNLGPTDLTDPADCVFALAPSQWLVDGTSPRSFDAAIDHLARLTKYQLVLEFVDDQDAGIGRDDFERALHRHFPRIGILGQPSEGRYYYVAYKTAFDVDLSGPLDLRFSPDRLLACRFLATVDGRAMWSAVFDLGDRIVKQTTDHFALHEARILRLLNEHTDANVPKVLDTEESDDWSTLTLERVAGVPLTKMASGIASNRRAFVRFTDGCIDLLDAMRKVGVVHRDVDTPNILVRDGLPVLMDFGWAVAPGIEIAAPPGIFTWRRAMNEPYATPEHCDVRSMGRLLLDMSAGHNPDLEALFGTMAEPAVSLRVQAPSLLRRWLRELDSSKDPLNAENAGLRELFNLAEGRRQRARNLFIAATSADREQSLLAASEWESLQLITFVHALCQCGLAERAQAVAACLGRSLTPDSPAHIVFSHVRTALEGSQLPLTRSATRGQIDVSEILAHAVCDVAGRHFGPQQDEALRCVHHCLSLIRERRSA